MSGCLRDAGISSQSIKSGTSSPVRYQMLPAGACALTQAASATRPSGSTTGRFANPGLPHVSILRGSWRSATTQTSVVRTDHPFTGKSQSATSSLPERHHAKAFRLKPAIRHTTGFGSGVWTARRPAFRSPNRCVLQRGRSRQAKRLRHRRRSSLMEVLFRQFRLAGRAGVAE